MPSASTDPARLPDWLTLSTLEVLVAVADHGSLSAGARVAGLAQPNASRAVARLERHLGVPLLHRSTAGSTLTASGLLVVEWARQVTTAAERFVEGAATLSATGAGSTTLSASQTVAEHLLPRWLLSLRTTHPELLVEVQVHNSQQVVDDVFAGRCELGFTEGPEPPSGVHHQVVAVDHLVLVVAPTHRWARRPTPVTREELAATPLITREAGSGTRVALDAELGAAATPLQELPSNAAVRVGVQIGAAPAVLSRLAVAEAIAGGSLVEVPTELRLRRKLRAVWTGPKRLHGPAAALVAAARADSAARSRG